MEMPCQSKIVDTPQISAKIELTRRDLALTFGATGGPPRFTFDCSLDGMRVGCGTFTNLPAGQHTFSVAAVDNSVNQDPQPPVCGWTINAVSQLIQLIHCVHLDFAIDRILDARPNAALQLSQHNLKSSTCGNLNGSVIQVQSELQVGHVTQTPGFQLIQAEQAVKRVSGC